MHVIILLSNWLVQQAAGFLANSQAAATAVPGPLPEGAGLYMAPGSSPTTTYTTITILPTDTKTSGNGAVALGDGIRSLCIIAVGLVGVRLITV